MTKHHVFVPFSSLASLVGFLRARSTRNTPIVHDLATTYMVVIVMEKILSEIKLSHYYRERIKRKRRKEVLRNTTRVASPCVSL
jgi:hypothetical protein